MEYWPAYIVISLIGKVFLLIMRAAKKSFRKFFSMLNEEKMNHVNGAKPVFVLGLKK